MSTKEELIVQLDDLQDLFKKARTNFKKCPKARLTRGYLQTKIQCIEEYWASFRLAHKHLVKLSTKDDRDTLPYFTQDQHSECEEVFISLKADMTDMLQVPVPTETTNSTSCVESQPEKIISSDIKLPTINLPVFTGAYEEWQSFEDIFISLVHNNKGLNNVQRLHYLKSCVASEAKNTIKHFQITEKNYTLAWDTLKNRYSHKRLIINALLKKLFSLRKINIQSPGQLKNLIDNTKEYLNCLNNLEVNTESWDPLIIFLTVQQLDQESHKEWETYVSSEYCDKIPSFKNLVTFLESRIHTLELTSLTTSKDKFKERSFHATTSQLNCKLCNENHLLCHCKEFGKMDPDKRSEYVREQRLCYNCLSVGHSVFQCKQKTSCRICNRRHHSLLHSFKKRGESTDTDMGKQQSGLSSLHINVEDEQEEPQNTTVASHFTSKHKRALLATALVPVRSSSGQDTILRALIDPGSQASFLSERAAQTLKLHRTSIQGTVTGVGSTQTSVSHVVQLEVLSRYEEKFSLKVKAYVLSTRLTTKLPYKSIKPKNNWSHLDGLTLADPKYFSPGKIDMLLGVEVYTEILKNNLIKGPPGTPCAQETNLGWILFGNIKDEQSYDETVVMHHHLDIDNMLKNMWDIDQTNKRNPTREDRLCEEIYTNTQSRTTDGRYIVKLPFKNTQPSQHCGKTKDIALKRFNQLEKEIKFLRPNIIPTDLERKKHIEINLKIENEEFKEEIEHLKKRKTTRKNSRLKMLSTYPENGLSAVSWKNILDRTVSPECTV